MQIKELVHDLRERLREKSVDLEDFPDIDTAPDEVVVTLGIVVFCCELKAGTKLEGTVNSDQVDWALEQADDTDEFLDIYAKNCMHIAITDQEDSQEESDDDDEQ